MVDHRLVGGQQRGGGEAGPDQQVGQHKAEEMKPEHQGQGHITAAAAAFQFVGVAGTPAPPGDCPSNNQQQGDRPQDYRAPLLLGH